MTHNQIIKRTGTMSSAASAPSDALVLVKAGIEEAEAPVALVVTV